MPRPAWVALFLVLVAVLTVGSFVAVDRLAGDEADITVEKPELGAAEVVRTDLRRIETFPAAIRFSDVRTVFAAATGTVTRVPAEGTELARGDHLLEIDGLPVFVFYGERPMWRSLGWQPDGSGVEGPDIEQLELNLEALGLPIRTTPDDTFDGDTVRLIRDWRAAAGLPEGDRVELGRLVYVPGAIRVGRSLVSTGALVSPGTPLVEVSSTRQEIRMDLPIGWRDRISVGDPVMVRLPDDRGAPGIVHDLGRVVPASPEVRGGSDIVEVSIRMEDPSQGPPFHGYPVEVELVTDQAVDVLAVPVKALLALSEGGYAVEVERHGQVELVGVKTGMFAGGLVEVEGDLRAGELVRVPK